jgi:hypothetical protein
MRQRPFIPQRRRIFLGCEGESEVGYGALLSRLAQRAGLHLFLDPIPLKPGGGDPLAMVELAVARKRDQERKRGVYAIGAILLDADRLGQAPERDARIPEALAGTGLRLIWQEPSFEALLLRHFERCSRLRPPTAAVALRELRRRWPEYEKGISAAELANRIAEAEIRRIMTVEPELRRFLIDLGFKPPD